MQQFAFSRINYILLVASIVLILVGYVLMSGSGSTDSQFNPEIFNTTRTVIAPAVCFVGYVMILVAILYPSRQQHNNTAAQETQDTTATQG